MTRLGINPALLRWMQLVQQYQPHFRNQGMINQLNQAGVSPIGHASRIVDMPSSFTSGLLKGGGIRGGINEVERRIGGDETATVMHTVPNRLGLKGIPAFAVGLAAEVGVPDPTDVMKMGRVGRSANAFRKVPPGTSKRLAGKMFDEDLIALRSRLNKMSPAQIIEESATNWGGRGTMTPLQAQRYSQESTNLLNRMLGR